MAGPVKAEWVIYKYYNQKSVISFLMALQGVNVIYKNSALAGFNQSDLIFVLSTNGIYTKLHARG
jgi:hypothetical protein